MNEVIKNIIGRRSVRAYTSESVSRSCLELIIEAAVNAPSGATAEPWHFRVMTDRSTIEELDARARAAMASSGIERIEGMGRNPNYRIFFGAPVVIMIYAERKLRKTGVHLSALADCSAAIENMALASASLGLGSCWIGLARYLFETDMCMAPDGFYPVYALALGHPAEDQRNLPPKKLREGTVSWG